MIGERYNKYHSFYENFSDNKELKMFFKKESYTSTINSLIAYSEDGDEAKRSFKDSAFYIKSKDFLKKLWLNIRIIFQKIKMFITNLLDKILKREKSSKIKVIIDSIKDINSKLDKMEKSFGKNKYLALLGKQVNISEIYLNKDFIDTINRNLNMACKSLLGDGGSYKGLLVYTQKYLNDYNRGRTGNIEWKKEYLDYIKYGQDINTYNPGYIDDYMTHEFGKEKSNEEIFGTNTYTLYDFFDKVQKPWKNLSSTMLNVENQLYKIEKVGRPLIKKLSSILALFKEWESTPTYDEDYEDLMSDYYDADEKAAREERYRFFRITIENLNNILSGLKTSTKAIYDNINVLYEYIIKKRKIIYSVMIEGEKVIAMTDLEKLKNSYNNLNNMNEGYSEGDFLFPKNKKKEVGKEQRKEIYKNTILGKINEAVHDMIYDVYFYTSDEEDASELYDLVSDKLEDGILPDFDENELLSEIKNVLENQSFFIDYDNDSNEIGLPDFETVITLDDTYDLSYGSMLNDIKYVFEGGMDPDFYDSVDEDELNSILKKFYNKAKKEFPKWLNINKKVEKMAKNYYKENGIPSYV